MTHLVIHAVSKPRPSPETQQYFFVGRDWEIDNFGGGIRDLGTDAEGSPRHGVPMVFRCTDLEEKASGHYTFLDKAWEFFTFDLLSISYFGVPSVQLSRVEYDWLAARWKGLYDGSTAFTNGKGTDTQRNWITNKKDDMNLDAEKGIGIYTIVCGGASLAGVPVFNSKGKKMLKVRAFDGRQPPPDISTINIRTDPRIFFADTITDIRVPGGYVVRPFTYLQNPITEEMHDVPIPLIARADIYYPFEDVKEYRAVARSRPYYP